MGIIGKVHRPSFENQESVLKIKKRCDEYDFTSLGALAEHDGGELSFSVTLPRRAGLCALILQLKLDGGEYAEFPLRLSASEYTLDTFECCVRTKDLPNQLKTGLYYYRFEFCFGSLNFYTDSINNTDFTLCESYPGNDFRLLVYDKNFTTPEWFRGNIMYHIFVDRFAKGNVKVPVSDTAVINPDWENGIPQFGAYPGAPISNNVFFGGTLWGVIEKLDYLVSLGVGCIYLSPIFKAYSNHKYDTGDYMTVDEMFGGEAALENLIREAKKRDVRIILDGVFNHTGDDSLYFNRYGRYDSIGAYQNEASEYRNWYFFDEKGEYKSWWDIEILPKLNLTNPECSDYFLGNGGVLEKYFDMGIGGIRLDVADELPSEFLERLRCLARNKDSQALIIGEVWENAADKISYGKRREYFRGHQLDSVMNYPVRNAIIEFAGKGDSEFFYNTVTELYASYPKMCLDVLMNILGTHDTERILTVLSGEDVRGLSNEQISVKRMTKLHRKKAIARLKIAAALQYTLFGVPSVYYGDEAGAEGYNDPFCRLPYPWGREESDLLDYYKKLGRIRRSESVLARGEFEFCEIREGFVCYRRFDENDEILVLANASKEIVKKELKGEYTELLDGQMGENTAKILPMTVRILKRTKKRGENK